MLDPRQIELIQDSFALVVPISDPVATLFYKKLFELRPEFRELFPDDMEAQRGKLVTTLAAVVKSLNSLDQIIGPVRQLGERHVGYGATAEDYAPVGEALIWTLRSALKNTWTDEHQEAWGAAYAILVKVMLEGAEGIQAA